MANQAQGAGLPHPPEEPNHLTAALGDDLNKVGLAAVAAAWMATGLLAVPFVGLAAEAAYLFLAPDSSWFRQRLRARRQAAQAAYRKQLEEQVLPVAPGDAQHAYAAMARARETIGQSVAAGDDTSREMLGQLDYMLEKYLLYSYQIQRYSEYLSRLSGDRAPRCGPQETAGRLIQEIDEQLARLRAQLQRAKEDATRAVVEQNIEVLAKKRALIERVAGLATNLALHLQLFKNSFDLVGGLVQTRAPGELLPMINDAISKAELTSAVSEQSDQIDEEIRQLRMEALQ